MKKLFIMIIALLSISLVACNDAQESNKIENTTPAEQKDVNKEPEQTEEEPSVQTSEGLKAGDTIDQDGLKGKLVSKVSLDKTIDMSPIQIHVADAQVVTLTDVEDPDFADFIGFTGEPLHYIRIDYAVENTSDKNVQINSPIRTIVLSTGEQIDTVDSFIWEETGGDFFGKSHKNDLAIAVPFKSDPEKVTSFRVITSTVDDMDFNELVQEKEASFELK